MVINYGSQQSDSLFHKPPFPLHVFLLPIAAVASNRVASTFLFSIPLEREITPNDDTAPSLRT